MQFEIKTTTTTTTCMLPKMRSDDLKTTAAKYINCDVHYYLNVSLYVLFDIKYMFFGTYVYLF